MPEIHPTPHKYTREDARPIVLTQSEADSFWLHVIDTGSCWEWCGGAVNSKGYGHIKQGRALLKAHRVSWTLVRGPIPSGLTLDHLCRNRLCVNPDHLEAVSNRENILRGTSPTAINARKTHCQRGHELTAANIIHYPKTEHGHARRACRLCAAARRSARYAKARAVVVQKPCRRCGSEFEGSRAKSYCGTCFRIVQGEAMALRWREGRISR